MASKDPKMSKQATDGKMKHATLTISQKLETIRKLDTGKSQRQVMASYNTASCYKETEEPIMIICGST